MICLSDPDPLRSPGASQSQSQRSASQSTSGQASSQQQPRGNAAAQDEMGAGAAEEGWSWWDSLTGAYDDVTGAVDDVIGAVDAVQSGAQAPVTAGINALGIDGLEAKDGAISYSNSALNFSESVDVPLGRLGPLSVGLFGTFSSRMQYSPRGVVEEGWFTNYATLDGSAHMDLDTSIGAQVALDVLVAEAGLRGALDLDGSIHLVVNLRNQLSTIHYPQSDLSGGFALRSMQASHRATTLPRETPMYRRRGEPSWQAIHDRARMRMEDMSDEHLKHIELALARSWRFLGPKPPMLRQLLREMDEAPAGPDHRKRVEHTLRRAFARMKKDGRRADEYEIAVATFLDGQIDTATRYLTPDIALRPWGEP